MRTFARARELLHASRTVGPLILAVLVGLGGGAAAILFKWLLTDAKRYFFHGSFVGLEVPWDLHVIFLPVVGLLIVGLLVRLAPEADGTGIPQVMHAVRKHGSRVRKRVATVKTLAALACIGTGGSLGREGPAVQIGASVASSISQALGLGEQRTRVLLACGAAAAIGGNFNAPIAGSLFVLEVILGSFGARDFGLVVVSSVAGTALSRAVLGDAPAFRMPAEFELLSFKELGFYLVLGVLCGLLAVVFRASVYGLGDAMARWKRPRWVRSVAGGLTIGLIGWIGMRFLGGPFLFGVGYDGISEALLATPRLGSGLALGAVGVLASLLVLKILATSLTLASGGSGGVFAPALFVGAMAGAAFGIGVGELFEYGVGPPGAYAIVGMGAVFGAAAHAPISTVVILFEMSDEYELILPLMLAVGVAYMVATRVSPESIYGLKLRRLGGLTPSFPEASTLDLVLVADAMAAVTETVRPETPLPELAARLRRGGGSLPVLDGEGRLVGVVFATAVWRALTGDAPRASRTAAELMVRELVTATPDESLREVLGRLEEHELGEVLVVDRKQRSLLLGVLRREEIFWAVGEMMTEHRQMLEASREHVPADAVQMALQVRPEYARITFRPVRDLGLPEGCLVAVLRRAGQAQVPRGDTVIEPGDVLVLLSTDEAAPALRAWIDGLHEG